MVMKSAVVVAANCSVLTARCGFVCLRVVSQQRTFFPPPYLLQAEGGQQKDSCVVLTS